MNSKTFFDTVDEMRSAQKLYKKDPSLRNFYRMVQLERSIDHEIKRAKLYYSAKTRLPDHELKLVEVKLEV